MELKTWKREIATLQLGIFTAFCIWAASGSDQAMEVARLQSIPTFTFLFGAFGLDWASKQMAAR